MCQGQQAGGTTPLSDLSQHSLRKLPDDAELQENGGPTPRRSQ